MSARNNYEYHGTFVSLESITKTYLGMTDRSTSLKEDRLRDQEDPGSNVLREPDGDGRTIVTEGDPKRSRTRDS